MRAEKENGFRYWRDPLFLLCLGLYFVNREWIKPHLHHYSALFHGHLNDILLVPVALPLFLFVYRRLGLRPDDAPPRFWEIGLHVVVWSIIYKGLGPSLFHQGVADPSDLLCFAGGGLMAWLWWNQILPGTKMRTLAR